LEVEKKKKNEEVCSTGEPTSHNSLKPKKKEKKPRSMPDKKREGGGRYSYQEKNYRAFVTGKKEAIAVRTGTLRSEKFLGKEIQRG